MSEAEVQVTALLKGMLEPDGYSAIVHSWPAGDTGPARIEIVPGGDACADCLVPKDVMRMVLENELPPGVSLGEADLLYPGEAA